mmetsp:Transcript_11451/g.29490  ORF Transcript_11451/g.29490 Transcript_11451/m.29490 type:complete len:278 (-) Transcript_11451:1010-1843(-)
MPLPAMPHCATPSAPRLDELANPRLPSPVPKVCPTWPPRAPRLPPSTCPAPSARRSSSASGPLPAAPRGSASSCLGKGGIALSSRSVSCRLRYSITSWLDRRTSCASVSFLLRSARSCCRRSSRSLPRAMSRSFSSSACLPSSSALLSSSAAFSCCARALLFSFSFALACFAPVCRLCMIWLPLAISCTERANFSSSAWFCCRQCASISSRLFRWAAAWSPCAAWLATSCSLADRFSLSEESCTLSSPISRSCWNLRSSSCLCCSRSSVASCRSRCS